MINKIITAMKRYYKYLLEHPAILDILLLLVLSIIPFISYGRVIIPETDLAYDINPLHAFLRRIFLWDGSFNFGIPVTNTINIYNIVNISLSKLNISSFLIKQIWFSLLLFVTGISMYNFIGVFLGKERRILKIISSFTYMYSLFLIRTLMGASTMVIGYVILPLILGLYINGLKVKKKYLYYAVLISLTSIIFSNINFTYIVIDAVAIFIFLLVYLIRNKNINFLHIFKFNILVLFLGLLISAWWIIPSIKISTLSSGFVAEGLGVETPKTYNIRSSYLETFRLLGDIGFSSQYKGTPDVPFSKFYMENPIWIVSTFLFAVLSICGLFFIRSKRKRLYLILLLAFFSAMAVGVYPITNPTVTGRIYLWCYDHIPLFSIFRNGYKSVAIISFVYAVLLGCFVLSIYDYLKNKFEKTNKYFYKALPAIFVFLVFGLILLNSFPLWMGKIFDNKKFQTVPSYWYEIGDYLSRQSLDFRVFMLPDSSFPIYYWGKPQGDVTFALINKPSIESMGRTWGYKKFTKLVYDSFPNQDNFNEMISLCNIKYIIQRNDIDWTYYNTNTPEKNKEMLLARDDLIFEKKFGELDLYRVKDAYILPPIYSPEIISYVGNDVDYINQAVSFNDYPLKTGIFFSDFGLNESSNKKFISEKINSVFVSVNADSDKINEMKLVVDEATDPAEKKKLQSDLDLYTKNLFFKDFKVAIPAKATYKIYLKQDSVLANNKNIGIQIGDEVLQKGGTEKDKEGWNYFNKIELEKGEHNFKLYIDNVLIDAINSGDIVLSAENLSEPIKTPQLEYKQINPTKYIVNVHGAKESFPLIFSESFHPGWKIYVNSDVVGKGSGQFVSEENQGTIQNENLNSGRFYDLLFRKPVLDDKHFLINGYANSWWMDLEELEKQQKVTRNGDGSYDFSINIEFEPQKYFYIGLLISGLSLIFCLGYLFANLYHWFIIKKVSKRKV